MTLDATEATRIRQRQDRWITDRVEEVRTAYEGGDQSKLLDLVFLCATYQVVIPDWGVDALLAVRDQLDEGRLRNLNDAFAWKHSDIRARAAKRRRDEHEQEILAALMRHRIARIGSRLNPGTDDPPDIDPVEAQREGLGGNFIANEGLQEIADRYAFRRRDVEAVYKKHRDLLRAIQKGGGGVGRAGMTGVMPALVERRRGRPLLRDD